MIEIKCVIKVFQSLNISSFYEHYEIELCRLQNIILCYFVCIKDCICTLKYDLILFILSRVKYVMNTKRHQKVNNIPCT